MRTARETRRQDTVTVWILVTVIVGIAAGVSLVVVGSRIVQRVMFEVVLLAAVVVFNDGDVWPFDGAETTETFDGASVLT